MKAIATELLNNLPSELGIDIVTWEELASSQQKKIVSAISYGCSEAITTPFHTPNCVVYPHTQAALGEVIRVANQKGWSTLTIGNGSKASWGGLVNKVDLAISTQNINRLIDHAVGDLTITIEAGMKLVEVQEILAKENQFLPIDSAFPQNATIGGIIATADTGSWRQRYGGVRDMVLGISFVRADGEIAKAGGRVVKNVAGYDLMKLLTGSFGTLGIISQVTLRTYPLPPDSRTILLTGDNRAIATAAQTLRNSSLTPTRADLLSQGIVGALGLQESFGLILGFQSLTASVEAQCQQIQKLGEELGLQTTLYQGESEDKLWQELTSLMVNPTSQLSVTCKIGVLPSTAMATLAYLDEVTSKEGLGLIHNGSGIGKLHFNSEKSSTHVQELRLSCQQNQGFLTILNSSAELKQKVEPWGYTGNAMAMMKGLKEKFDPQNILSPGRFFN